MPLDWRRYFGIILRVDVDNTLYLKNVYNILESVIGNTEITYSATRDSRLWPR